MPKFALWRTKSGYIRRLTVLFLSVWGCNNAFSQASSIQATFYVSPSGSGSVFSSSHPGNIEQVRAKVRSINQSMTGDIVVYLKEGWYQLDHTFALSPLDGGTNNYSVIYQAEENARVVLSGGKRVTGWRLHDGTKNIWKATSPAHIGNRQLYVDCVRAVRAHKGSGLPGAQRNSRGYTTSDNTMQNWGNKTDIEFVYNALQGGTGGSNWTERRVGVASISGTTITMKQPAWSNACAGDTYQAITKPTDIENAYELLDQPGEWYLDRSAGIVFYIPRSGQDVTKASVIAPVLETLVSITGEPGTPVHHIQFKDLTFAHATFLRPSGDEGWPEIQANYGTSRTPGNISCSSANNLYFEHCIFKHLGGVGLDLYNGAQDNVVTGCVFTDISGTCLQIGNINDPVRSDRRTRDIGNQITNNYFHNAPCEYRGGAGIWCGYVSDVLISHNEICYNSYSAVSIGWGWGTDSYARNNLLTFNDFHHYCQELADGGAIYSLSAQPNSSWHDNYAHDIPNGQRPMWRAWYTDEGSAYIDIHHNVNARIGNADWYSAWTPTIHDNQIHDNYTDTKNFTNAGTRCVMKNNTVVLDSHWPQEALDIMNGAGIEIPYQSIKTASCACSLLSADQGSIPPDLPSGSFGLAPNYPNPFNHRTTIGYSLPDNGRVRLIVYNLLGQRVRVLLDMDENKGFHQVIWDGVNDLGLNPAKGVYLCRLEFLDKAAVRKLILLE
jgi:hypothetical protein